MPSLVKNIFRNERKKDRIFFQFIKNEEKISISHTVLELGKNFSSKKFFEKKIKINFSNIQGKETRGEFQVFLVTIYFSRTNPKSMNICLKSPVPFIQSFFLAHHETKMQRFNFPVINLVK